MNDPGTIEALITFLRKLKQAGIYYSLADPTPSAIMVTLAVPGERWEVEFQEDGTVDVEVFISTGTIDGIERIDELYARYAEEDDLEV